MQPRIRPWRVALFGSIVVGTAFSLAGVGMAGTAGPHLHGAAARQHAVDGYVRAPRKGPKNNHTPDDGDLADVFAAFDNERTAPAGSVSGTALVDAAKQAAKLPA